MTSQVVAIEVHVQYEQVPYSVFSPRRRTRRTRISSYIVVRRFADGTGERAHMCEAQPSAHHQYMSPKVAREMAFDLARKIAAEAACGAPTAVGFDGADS